MPGQQTHFFNVAAYFNAMGNIASAIANAISEANAYAGGLIVIPAGLPAGGTISTSALGPNTIVIDFRQGMTVYASGLAGQGHPAEIASLSALVQSAAIASTVLVTAAALPGAGLYRVNASIIVHAAGSAGTVTVGVTSNNGVANVTQTSGTLSATATAGTELDVQFNFYSGAGQPIKYQTTFSGVTGAFTYDLRLAIEFLG